jgi:hypothetical protein
MISEQDFKTLLKKAIAGERDYSKLLPPGTYSVELIWRLYRETTMPPDAGDVQRIETRQAFMAGYSEAFKAVTEYAAALDEDVACGFLTKLQTELNEIVEDMLARVRARGAPHV